MKNEIDITTKVSIFNDSLVMTRFVGGFFDGDGKVKFYLNDYQGNNIAVIDADGKVIEKIGYYPYGMP